MKKAILWIAVLSFYPALIFAQAGQSASDSQKTSASENEVQELRDALAAQKQETQALREQLQQVLNQMAQSAPQPAQPPSTPPANVGKAKESQLSMHAPGTPPPSAATQAAEAEGKIKESPLSFRIGGADFTPGGFVDIANVYRSTDVGSGTPTSFYSIPYSNTTAGGLSEDRISAQNSRLTFKVTDHYAGNDVTGYMEMDFNGNNATNVYMNTNPNTARLRLFWVDVVRGKWEFLGGQSWGWLTPNRVGLSPNPPDIYNTQNVDNNYQVGITYTRAPQFRVAYHFNPHWAWGVAVENAEQFAGQSGEVTYPTAYSTALAAELDAANLTSTPNKYPDIISKLAYDTDLGGKHFHADAAGLATTIQADVTAGRHGHSATGGGIEGAADLELLHHFYLVTNMFYSDGGGRYIGGLGPDAVIRPNGIVSLVHSGAGTGGFEYQFTRNDMFAAYYGGAYFQRDYFLDTSTGAKAGTFEGFGFPGSANSNNRSLQEATFDYLHTFWKSPAYGALQLYTQFSYITRSPWSFAAGAPKNAHLGMNYIDIRYVLP
jgi:uncharacterized coiled-coil protein SlyX